MEYSEEEIKKANELSEGLRFYFYPHLCSLVDKRRTEIILGNIKGWTVLDAGSGKGNISLCAWKLGFNVTAVDLSKSSLDDASFLFNHENAGIQLYYASLTNLPMKNDVFDTVICTGVLEHIPRATEALKEMWRVLKDKGRLIISVPNARTFGLVYDHFVSKIIPEKKQTPIAYRRYFKITEDEIAKFGWDNKIIFSHCQNYSFKKIRKILQSGGFEILKIKQWRFLNPYLRSIGTLCGIGPIKIFERIDLAIAKYVPHELASEWLFVCEKRT